MKTTKFRRLLSLVLALAMSLSLASIASAKSPEDLQKEAFDALPDDAIVCYMYGQPVYKYEVDENGYVDKDFGSPVQTRNSANGATLPTAHRGETIEASVTMVTTGFSQTENTMYLPKANAYQGIVKIRSGASAVSSAIAFMGTFAGAVTGSTPIVQKLTGITKVMISSGATSICNKIEANYNAGSGSQVDCVTSSYGQFCNVSSWNGLTCAKSGYTSGSTVVTVNSVTCYHGNVWG